MVRLYDINDTFHEPLMLFSWLAGLTELEFATGILVAPQRETALLAKQAAELDVLTGGGRLRLGLGIGWNEVEYEALGQPFDHRGARLEEQITLLRRLWTEQSVTFEGRFHTVTGAGIAPLPATRPIPLWLGGAAPAALEGSAGWPTGGSHGGARPRTRRGPRGDRRRRRRGRARPGGDRPGGTGPLVRAGPRARRTRGRALGTGPAPPTSR